MEVKLNDLAYAAGFIEADGCFHLTNSGVAVRVSNKHVPTLEWFKEKFGGRLNSKVKPTNCWDWNLHGPNAVEFTKQLLPFLKMKIREADILIKFGSKINPRGKKVSEELKSYRNKLRQEIKDARKCR